MDLNLPLLYVAIAIVINQVHSTQKEDDTYIYYISMLSFLFIYLIWYTSDSVTGCTDYTH